MDDNELAKLDGPLPEISDEYRRQLETLARDLSVMFQSAGQLASEVGRTLAKMDWPKLVAHVKESCERLALLGWTLPMTFTPRETVELLERCKTDIQVEQYMLEYYTVEDGRFFLSIRDKVLRSGTLAGSRVLLEQCFDAYDRGHYCIPIPALLSVIEGGVAQKADKLKTPTVNPKPLAAGLEKAAHPDSVQFLRWQSTRIVLEKLFARSDFAGPHPREVNRHWILHGRDQTQWTQADALRLFNLLATIC